MSTDMQNILSEVAEEFSTAEIFNQWMPPDGTYTALVIGYADGVSQKGSSRTAWWRLDGRLIVPGDADLNDKESVLALVTGVAAVG